MSNTHGMPDALGVLTAMEDPRATDNPMVSVTVYDGNDAFEAFSRDIDNGTDLATALAPLANPHAAAEWLAQAVEPFTFYVTHLEDVPDLAHDETMILRYGTDPDLRLAIDSTPPPADVTHQKDA